MANKMLQVQLNLCLDKYKCIVKLKNTDCDVGISIHLDYCVFVELEHCIYLALSYMLVGLSSALVSIMKENI